MLMDVDEEDVFCDECCTKFRAKDLNIKYMYDDDCNIICKSCAYKIWTRICVKCKSLFESPDYKGILVPCPTCEEDEDKERYGRKLARKRIDKLFKE